MFACVNEPIASMHFAREKHANEGSKGQFCSLGQCKFFLSACLFIKNPRSGNKNSQGMSNSGYITLNMVNTLKVKEYSSYIAIQA